MDEARPDERKLNESIIDINLSEYENGHGILTINDRINLVFIHKKGC